MSSYRWIIFAVAAAMLGIGAWYFGRPVHPKPMPEDKRVASTTPAPVETPKELPPKVIEVIDLTQAYEPVREPETVALGHVDPASFIEEQSAPARIPYAVDEDNLYRDLLVQIRETPVGSLLFGVPLVKPERIDVMPREVPFILGAGIISEAGIFPVQSTELLEMMPREVVADIHMTITTGIGILRNDPPTPFWPEPRGRLTRIEWLDVMPREVRPLFPQQERERNLTADEAESLGIPLPLKR